LYNSPCRVIEWLRKE